MNNRNGILILPRRPKHKPFDEARPADPRRQCEGKVAHRNRESALVHAHAAGPELRAYACPHCHRWHVGNSTETLVISVHIRPAGR
jgi:hypothetical protein